MDEDLEELFFPSEHGCYFIELKSMIPLFISFKRESEVEEALEVLEMLNYG